MEAFAGETGGGNIETCKYKIAQFKTQTKEEVAWAMGHGAWGVAGHVLGNRVTCKAENVLVRECVSV